MLATVGHLLLCVPVVPKDSRAARLGPRPHASACHLHGAVNPGDNSGGQTQLFPCQSLLSWGQEVTWVWHQCGPGVPVCRWQRRHSPSHTCHSPELAATAGQVPEAQPTEGIQESRPWSLFSCGWAGPNQEPGSRFLYVELPRPLGSQCRGPRTKSWLGKAGRAVVSALQAEPHSRDVDRSLACGSGPAWELVAEPRGHARGRRPAQPHCSGACGQTVDDCRDSGQEGD